MKRVMAIILAAIILFASFTPVVAIENSKAQTENEKIKWLVENNFLVGRGKSRDLKLGSSITRAEFTRMALVAKGEEDVAKEKASISVKFKDVDETHWAAKLISYASEKGYISGYPDGNFKPEGEITYEEVISILARIHPNYTKIEAKSNGWAEGFINFAAENGILEELKIESSYKSPAIREKTFEMIYNFKNIENNHAKETKSTKPIETKNDYFGWNGFYPYWFQFGYRPRVERPDDPEVKPEPGTPDVKPEPEEPKEPETPEMPKEFDAENIETITVKTQPKLTYTEGDKLDLTGLVVTLTDNQGLTKDVEFKDFKEYGLMTDPTSEKQLTADYNGTKIKITKGNLETETNALTVNEKVFDPSNITKIQVKDQPTKLKYTEEEILNLAGLVITLIDNQGLTKEVGLDKFGEYGITTSPENGTPLIMDHNGKPVVISKDEVKAETDALTVNPKVFDKEKITGIEVLTPPTKLEYTEGEKLDLTGLVVTLTDNQGLTKNVEFKDFIEYEITVSIADKTSLTVNDHNGAKITVTKGNFEAQTDVLTVNPKVFDKGNITKIEVKAQPNLTYTDGEQLDLTRLEVTLTDHQGLTKDVKFENFDDFNITIYPENGTPLTADYNETKIKITKGNLETETNTLTVKAFDKDNITKIEVITQPKLEYFEREFLDLTGLKVRLTDNKGATKEVEFKDFNEYGIKTRPSNDRQLLIGSYKEVEIYKGTIKTTTAPLIIKKRFFDINLLDSIGIAKQPKTNYTKGEKLNLAGMEILLVDKNGATEKFWITGIIAKGYKLEITPSDGTVLGVEHNKQPVIVKVNNKQTKTKLIYVYIKVDFKTSEKEVYLTKKIQPDTTVKKPDAPKREGYNFMGWYTDLTFETPFDFDKALNDNMEVYAKWEKII